MLKKFIKEQSGATAIEYALIASMVSISVIGALLLFQNSATEMFEHIRVSILDAISG